MRLQATLASAQCMRHHDPLLLLGCSHTAYTLECAALVLMSSIHCNLQPQWPFRDLNPTMHAVTQTSAVLARNADVLFSTSHRHPSSACWILQLDNLPAGDNIIDIQDALGEITGARSVPRVFIGGKFIGGGDDTAAKASNGELKQLLVAAGVVKE